MYEFKIVDYMEKVLPANEPPQLDGKLHVFSNDRATFQLAYHTDDYGALRTLGPNGLKVVVDWPYFRMRNVVLVPCAFPTTGLDDEWYLTKEPGMLPDRLEECDGTIRPVAGQWRSLWIDLFTGEIENSGQIDVTVSVLNGDETVYSSTVILMTHHAHLEQTDVHHTQWLHVDCLADYYHLEPYCEEHWRIVENFIRFLHDETAADMLYTPLVTPPLDTFVGGERTTVQLFTARLDKGKYEFDFSRLRRYASIAYSAGFRYLEISHLFTQWGAAFCPKIIVQVDGVEKKLFGWETASTDVEYTKFLNAIIPTVVDELGKCGFDRNHLYFHISDEPRDFQMPIYLKTRKSIENLLSGLIKFDALSSYDFYREKAVDIPVVAANHIDQFIERGASPLWVYYCVSQGRDVPNRFIALPSWRSRIIGLLIYMHDIKGFLHWGFNFYNSQYSRSHIDPYVTTDADAAFPSGDPFLVYPGADGRPVSSIRNEVIYYTFRDLRILNTAEKVSSRETVLSVIGKTYSFSHYPRNAEYIRQTMEKICGLVEEG